MLARSGSVFIFNTTELVQSVLHLDSNAEWGGGQNQVRLLMRALAATSFRQLCITPRQSALAGRLRSEGLPVHEVPWRGGADPRAFMAIAGKLARFEIVHCHDAHALQLAVLPAKLRGTRVVAARRVRFKTNAFKWNLADRVVAVSESVREELLKSGVQAHRIVVIHSGTDLAETRAVLPLSPTIRQRYAIPESAFVAGNAAAMYEAKGQTLIPAAAALLPEVHWIIAGDGPERPRIEAAIEQYGVRDRVHLTGWLADARPMLRELDAYVSTSVDDGLGNSITEALALRIPVIAANAGGPAEIVAPVHRQVGTVLFEPRNASDLARAIVELRRPGVHEEVIKAQDKRFQDFTIERTAQQTADLYLELMRR